MRCISCFTKWHLGTIMHSLALSYKIWGGVSGLSEMSHNLLGSLKSSYGPLSFLIHGKNWLCMWHQTIRLTHQIRKVNHPGYVFDTKKLKQWGDSIFRFSPLRFFLSFFFNIDFFLLLSCCVDSHFLDERKSPVTSSSWPFLRETVE